MFSTRLCLGVALLSGAHAQTTCYKCRIAIDQTGATYGFGNDIGCDSKGDTLDQFETVCEANQVCQVDILVSWEETGRQTTVIDRSCTSAPKEDTQCVESFDGFTGTRDCKRTCSGDRCNDQSLIDIMAEEGLAARDSLSCQTCNKGDTDCENGLAATTECPAWTRASCFVAEVKIEKEGEQATNEYNRGCSAFSTTRKCRSTTINLNGVKEVDTTCKATCSSDNCNDKSTSELRDGCYTCKYTEDQTGAVLGMSNLNCFDSKPGDEYLQVCAEDQVCGTTVRVDWQERGVQTIHVERSCVNKDFQHGDNLQDNNNPCIGNAYLLQPADNIYKECNSVCEGPACNDESEYAKLLAMFDHGNIESCYNCKYEKDYYGNAIGKKDCAKFDIQNIESKRCPEWANAACFTAGSWYSSTQGITQVDYEEDHRGCSAFEFWALQANEGDCHSGSNAESSWSDCKYTCAEDNCNTVELVKKKQCHVCTSMRNTVNETIGTGDSNCFDRAELTPVEQCESEDDVCRTDLEQDWRPLGEVLTTIRRGCSKKDNVPTSCTSSSSSLVTFKDCAVTCETSGCNIGIDEVAEKFREGLETEVEQCNACYYTESDDGFVGGNAKCIDKPFEIEGIEIDCPVYARAGCYTGSNIHQVGNKEVEQVYRGCLFFKPPKEVDCFQEEYPTVNGNSVSFGICKESCSFTNCNDQDHIKPENPGSGWAKCQVCQIGVDEKNQTVGAGQEGCWDGDKRYDQFCPNEDDLCETEFLVDWFPRGYHFYQMKRQCRSRQDSKQDGCTDGGQVDILSFRDCFYSCDPAIDGPSCNRGMDAVPDEAKDEVVESCYSCQYSQDVDGTVSGIPGCGQFNGIQTARCPSYSSKSCYNAASYHRSYGEVTEDFEDDFRGCSPFVINRPEGRDCSTQNIEGLDHINCKETCDENDCNTGVLQKRKQCYTCTASFNSEGQVIGVGNGDCMYNPRQSMLEDCPNESDVCMDELLADWMMKGEQTFIIKRSCSTRQASTECTNGNTGKVQFKDCEASCGTSGCNNDLSVAEKFKSGTYQNPSCYTCRYVEDDKHNVSGNKNCEANPASTIKECPAYASVGCFTGSATHRGVFDDEIIEEHYKGCSAFRIENGGILDYFDDYVDLDGTKVEYHVVKSTCTGENCNKIIYKPDTNIGKSMCQVCQVNVDQHNNTVGIGEDKCWEGHSSLVRDCGPDSYCVTELEVDWYARGLFNYRLKRGCAPVAEAKECYEGSSSLVFFKDCEAVCDPSQNSGCNDGLDAVAEKFSKAGGPPSCYHCSYYENSDGTVEGDKNCGEEQALTDGRPTLRCPKYANAACFTAASYHNDYINENSKFEDDYRGCSPFDLEESGKEGKQCTSQDINGFKHYNCKETCTTANCNYKKTDSGLLQCHSCSVTLDHEGNRVGIGSPMCLDNPSADSLVQCSADATECSTEIIVDWMATGKQHITVRRSCLENTLPDKCDYGESPRIMYKDCFDRCEGNGCNDNLDVAEKLNESGNKQGSCVTCTYVETENGDVQGNFNCPDSPTEEMKKSCPVYANAACFTGSAIHNANGEELEEVYKGCSTFTVDGGIKKYQEEIGNIEYSLVKESCTTDNCNDEHTRPDPIKEKGLSCYVCQISKDHLGNTIGTADESCWGDFPGDHLRSRCMEDQICVTELLVDWFAKGNQVTSLVRRCGELPPEDVPINPITGGICFEGASSLISYKDCFSYCYESGCNYNMNAVLDLHDTGNEIECIGCQYGYGYNGEVLPGSDERCHQAEITDSDLLMKCPKYANAACFTASTFDVIGSEQAVHDYKGCSAFRFEAEQCRDQPIDENNSLTTCKSTCDEDGCNNKTQEKKLACYTCDVTVDSSNKTIGIGQADCLDSPDISRLQYCWQDDAVCTTDFYADWGYNGKQYYRMRRGCGSAKSTEEGCQSANMLNGQVSYKDCVEVCDSEMCNDNFDIAEKFSTNGHDSCFTCSYIEHDDGTVEGNKFCADAPDKLSSSANTKCPIYADAGCYTGTNVHLNIDGSGTVLEEVYKGCSTFDAEKIQQWPNGTDPDTGDSLPICYTAEGIIDGNGNALDLNTCKEFCNTTNCNKYHASPDAPEDPVVDDAFKCFACQITKDHMGNTIGAGEESCWTNNPAQRFLVECEAEDAVCVTNMAIDWAERGEQYIILTRGCGTRRVNPGGQQCIEERLDSHMFRDCVEYCEDSKCNDWMDGVVGLHDQKNDISCHQCQSGFNLDGTTLPGANTNCHDPDVTDIIPSVQCPRYLNAACYTAATWRLDFDDNFEERDFKGCSGFRLEEGEEACTVNKIDEGSVTTCKTTCDENNCNNLTPQKSRQCYVCEVTVDSDEHVVGVGHQSCFNKPAAIDLQYCPEEKDSCVTEMKVDWDIWGAQTVTISRGCATSASDDYCVDNGQNAENAIYKDCFKYCTDDACNNIFDEIAQEFSSDKNQEECYSCKYIELEDGSVEGNKACFDSPSDINAEHPCPIYANAGCYTGSTAFYDAGNTLHEQVYKGCSSFEYVEGKCSQFKYDDGSGNEFDVASCKQYCTGNDCNVDHISPDPVDVVRCYNCFTMKDHMGNILGTDDGSCWSENPDISYLVNCEVGSQCITDLVVDWYSHGEQVAILQRRCGPKPSQELPDKAADGQCIESQNGQNLFKSCSTACDTNGCNKQLEEVMDLHDNKNDLECYSCLYGYNYDGNLYPNSNPKCTLPSVIERVPTMKCPKYMNAACFTASSWDFSWGDSPTEEDYKGCSAFRLESEMCGKIGDITGGARRETCKDTCDEDKCNHVTTEKRLSCYNCEVTVNSLNETIGMGDFACFENPATRHLSTCGNEDNYCKTEMLVDWMASGQQEYKIIRSCASTVAKPCSSGSTLNDHIYFKDCEVTCTDSGCNTGLDQISQYFDSGNAQESCYTCSYLEKEDGSVEGNEYCGDESSLIKDGSKACPKYANAGCFTGTNVHYVNKGSKELEQVYKGCSTFTPKETPSCYNLTGVEVADGIYDYAICKEYCEGQDCNEYHKKPDLPPSLSSKRCYQCSTIEDHTGNVLGQSDGSCFSDTPSREYLQLCEDDDDVCVTDLFVEWQNRGGQRYGIRRRCAKPNTVPEECLTEENGLYKFKDCSVTCEDSSCNAGLDEVLDKHDNGNNNLSCYNCQYGYDYSGNLLTGSDIRCQEESVSGSLVPEKCPRYANAGCFTAASWDHSRDQIVEEDHKGCSAFLLPENEPECSTQIMGGSEVDVCRKTCTDNACNFETPQRVLTCFVCDVTVDSSNSTIGVGRPECFTNQPYPGDLKSCPVNAPYCITEMEVTWTQRGNQATRLKRGCSAEPAMEVCKTGTTADLMYKYQDCQVDCDESGCNSDIDRVAELFRSSENQEKCLTCSYIEEDSGNIIGNKNCIKPETNSSSTACPIYANAGCYTATNTHEGSKTLLHEVYRGCSTFDLEEKTCVTDAIVSPTGNYEAETCKDYCIGLDCNDSSTFITSVSIFVLILLLL